MSITNESEWADARADWPGPVAAAKAERDRTFNQMASGDPMYGNDADPTIWATGATAGIPGTWTPPGSLVPPSLAEVTSLGVVASPATPWTTGQFMQTQVAGAAGRCCWTGAAWVGGAAP